VYVSGCKEFLALVGPSYQNRLWCVLELYTHLAISGVDTGSGRRFSKVTFLGKEMEKDSVFRVTKAKCFEQSMEQRLLAIVERSYPNLDDFNSYIQAVIDGADGFADDLLSKAERGSGTVLAAKGKAKGGSVPIKPTVV